MTSGETIRGPENAVDDRISRLVPITVVIPTYRRPRLLKRAIESVLAQSWNDFKISIYDNASEDQTADVVNSYAAMDPRVEYFCHAHNTGLVNNFIFAIENVRTAWLFCLSLKLIRSRSLSGAFSRFAFRLGFERRLRLRRLTRLGLWARCSSLLRTTLRDLPQCTDSAANGFAANLPDPRTHAWHRSAGTEIAEADKI